MLFLSRNSSNESDGTLTDTVSVGSALWSVGLWKTLVQASCRDWCTMLIGRPILRTATCWFLPFGDKEIRERGRVSAAPVPIRQQKRSACVQTPPLESLESSASWAPARGAYHWRIWGS